MAYLQKRNNSDDKMEGSWWASFLWGKMLGIWAVFDCLNAITKERKPKVTNAHDILGSGHTREVTTTIATVTRI